MHESDAYRSIRMSVEEALGKTLAECAAPEPLREAMAYSLLAGGKRVRPVLLVASCELFERPHPSPLPAACALEFIHTYSLIHDDLPALDNDDLRRGRPTSHRRFGEAMAILAGDALLTEAFGVMARCYPASDGPVALRALTEVATAAGASGMVGGQALDVLATGRRLTLEELERIHQLKTGALLVSAVRCGGILGGADGPSLDALTAYGRDLGLAFQVADDLLDVVGDSARLGKTTGKDAEQGKNSFAAQLGLEAGRALVEELTGRARARVASFGPRAEVLAGVADMIRATVS